MSRVWLVMESSSDQYGNMKPVSAHKTKESAEEAVRKSNSRCSIISMILES